jgi:hypothetical protein
VRLRGSIWRFVLRRPIRPNAPVAHKRLFPELASGFDGVNAGIFPPGRFVAHTVHQAMMDAAERDREFVTRFAAERPRLHEA